jgi:hypothetical protein
MFQDKKQADHILDSLLDLKKKYSEERYNLGGLKCLRKKDMMLDVLPFIYQMIHPEVREINIQLFDTNEKHIFLTALELMVMFDIKIKQK